MTWFAQYGGHGYSNTLHFTQNAVFINMNRFKCAITHDGTVMEWWL